LSFIRLIQNKTTNKLAINW